MHRSVLTNKKYIKFADANTVEVISMGGLERARGRGDKRAETYKGKDGKQYVVGWPNLTPEEFESYKSQAFAKGFLMVSASPLTRSSYHAGDDFRRLRAARAAKLEAAG